MSRLLKCGWLDLSHGGSIYIIDFSKCYISQHCLLSPLTSPEPTATAMERPYLMHGPTVPSLSFILSTHKLIYFYALSSGSFLSIPMSKPQCLIDFNFIISFDIGKSKSSHLLKVSCSFLTLDIFGKFQNQLAQFLQYWWSFNVSQSGTCVVVFNCGFSLHFLDY